MIRSATCSVIFLSLAWPGECAGGDLPPLIPREILFGSPDRVAPKISPDGRMLAYLAPHEGVLNVWVRALGSDDDRVVTAEQARDIRSYFWAGNSRQILYVQDRAGDANGHLYRVDLDSRETRDLTPFQGVRVRIVAIGTSSPDEILIAINRRNPELHDLFRVDLTTGDLSLEVENNELLVAWVVDRKLSVRAAARVLPDGGFELLERSSPDGTWRSFAIWGPEDTFNSGPSGVTPDGRGLYVLSSKNSNRTELRRIEVATGRVRILAADRHADIGHVLTHPVSGRIQAVAMQKERVHWKVLDESIRRDFAAIECICRGDFSVIDRDRADQRWLIAYDRDNGPISYHLFDRKTQKARFLFTNRKALEGLTLARMEPISFRARDGLKIRGYLTTPPGLRVRGLPMVVRVHGGLRNRDSWGYDGVNQWLANRGYAVLQINHRGSAGYGKKFVNAGRREWGGKIQSDLVDGVAWAIQRRIADPKRVAIFGASFGGYAVLAGLAFTPDVFCCGVDISGPSNLITFVSNLPPYLKAIEPLIFDRIGHPVNDAEFLRSRSPLFFIERISKPLLIAQGANDPTVTKADTMILVDALREAGKPVEYVEYADEGHGFSRAENRLDFHARAEKFLAKHLGGRFEE